MGFGSRQMTPRVWLLERQAEDRIQMDTKVPFLSSSSTEESVLLTANPFFLPPLPTWFPTTTKHHPECATPQTTGGTQNSSLSHSQSLLWCPVQPPQVGLGSSALRTSSSRSSRKHRDGTACWVGPRHTTGRTEWLQECGQEGVTEV